MTSRILKTRKDGDNVDGHGLFGTDDGAVSADGDGRVVAKRRLHRVDEDDDERVDYKETEYGLVAQLFHRAQHPGCARRRRYFAIS